MIDHVGFKVSDYATNKAFYQRVLARAFFIDPVGHNIEAVCHAPEAHG